MNSTRPGHCVVQAALPAPLPPTFNSPRPFPRTRLSRQAALCRSDQHKPAHGLARAQGSGGECDVSGDYRARKRVGKYPSNEMGTCGQGAQSPILAVFWRVPPCGSEVPGGCCSSYWEGRVVHVGWRDRRMQVSVWFCWRMLLGEGTAVLWRDRHPDVGQGGSVVLGFCRGRAAWYIMFMCAGQGNYETSAASAGWGGRPLGIRGIV